MNVVAMRCLLHPHVFPQAHIDGREQGLKDGVGLNKNNTSKFKHIEDLIHINEKWFYLTKDGQCFIIVADEAEPYRHAQHKLFLTKIMFLCAVARPRYNMNKNAWFHGKIGLWPIRKWELAKQSSKKCTKGMPVWKNQSITWDVYWEYLIQKLLKINVKWN